MSPALILGFMVAYAVNLVTIYAVEFTKRPGRASSPSETGARATGPRRGMPDA